MDNFTLQSPYSHLVVLVLRFTLFKILLPALHSKVLKSIFIEIQEDLPISSLMMLINWIKYRGTVEVFSNGLIASNNLNYLYFSNKYHNYSTFTLAIGLNMIGV